LDVTHVTSTVVYLHSSRKIIGVKKFASWLRLVPNNKISGGRTLSRRIPKGSNRLKIALRNAANAVGRLKETDLGRFFWRINLRKGRQADITATARKMVFVIWHMVTHKVVYIQKTLTSSLMKREGS